MSDLEHLKLCIDRTHHAAYQCARCNGSFCLDCDHATDADYWKTIVRYCPDWRCQREMKLENGELVASPKVVGEPTCRGDTHVMAGGYDDRCKCGRVRRR